MRLFWGASLLDPRCHDNGSVFTTTQPKRVLQSLIMEDTNQFVDTQRYDWSYVNGKLVGEPLVAADRLSQAEIDIRLPDMEKLIGPLISGRLLVFYEPITPELVIARLNELAGKPYLDSSRLDVVLGQSATYKGEQTVTITPKEGVYLFQGTATTRALYTTSKISRYFNRYTDGYMEKVAFTHQISIVGSSVPEQMFDTTGYRLTGFDGMVFDLQPDDMLQLTAGMLSNMYAKLYLPNIPTEHVEAGVHYNLVYEVVELDAGARVYIGGDTNEPGTELAVGATGAMKVTDSFNVRIQGSSMSKALIRVRIFQG